MATQELCRERAGMKLAARQYAVAGIPHMTQGKHEVTPIPLELSLRPAFRLTLPENGDRPTESIRFLTGVTGMDRAAAHAGLSAASDYPAWHAADLWRFM